jgi:hypothetical protein
MSEIATGTNAAEEAVWAVLMDLSTGRIEHAIRQFSDEFRFQDHAIGVEFKDKEQLGQFFQKARELYSDPVRQTDTIAVSSETVILQWTLQATITEPYYGGFERKVRATVHGASVVRTQNKKIVDWADYYDWLTSRRTNLAAYFTEWVEL